MFLLNDQGQIYSYGFGDFGGLGQGGTSYIQLPKLIAPLRDRYIV